MASDRVAVRKIRCVGAAFEITVACGGSATPTGTPSKLICHRHRAILPVAVHPRSQSRNVPATFAGAAGIVSDTSTWITGDLSDLDVRLIWTHARIVATVPHVRSTAVPVTACPGLLTTFFDVTLLTKRFKTLCACSPAPFRPSSIESLTRRASAPCPQQIDMHGREMSVRRVWEAEGMGFVFTNLKRPAATFCSLPVHDAASAPAAHAAR
jgi:hypothetical protein